MISSCAMADTMMKFRFLDTTDEVIGFKMAAGCFFVCSLAAHSAFTNPRRAIDGISGSLLSMEQGEALRMLGGVLLWGRGSRVVPPLPSCLTPSGKERFGASAETGRLPGRDPELRDSLILYFFGLLRISCDLPVLLFFFILILVSARRQ